MIEYLDAVTLSGFVTLTLIPLVRAAVLRVGIVDVPNGRSSHDRVVPRGAGLACAIGIVSAAVAAQFAGRNVPWSLVISALALSAVGMVDDRRPISPVVRLGVQAATGALLGFVLGSWLFLLIGMFLFPFMVNTVNFMDGINGLTGATAAIWGATTMFTGVSLGLTQIALVGALVLGSSLGFLPWNFPVGRIFLGDVGSYLVGALIAATLLQGAVAQAPMEYLVAPLILYIFDVTYTLFRRFFRGRRLTEAHREHLYQRLVHECKFPHARVTLLIVSLSITITIAWLFGSKAIGVGATSICLASYLTLTSRISAMKARNEQLPTDRAILSAR